MKRLVHHTELCVKVLLHVLLVAADHALVSTCIVLACWSAVSSSSTSRSVDRRARLVAAAAASLWTSAGSGGPRAGSRRRRRRTPGPGRPRLSRGLASQEAASRAARAQPWH